MREGLTSKEAGFTLLEQTEKGTREVLLAANSERDKTDWLGLLFSTQVGRGFCTASALHRRPPNPTHARACPARDRRPPGVLA